MARPRSPVPRHLVLNLNELKPRVVVIDDGAHLKSAMRLGVYYARKPGAKMEIPAKGWHGDLAPERLLQKGVLHGTKSCGRHVGDAGGGWRQTLLRHRWGRVKSGDRRATAQWENRVHPRSS